jgi:uncharacterized membrane protein
LNLLISGLLVFLATHLIPSFQGFRNNLIDKLTPIGYRLSFSLLSIASIVLIVYGLKDAEFQPLYEPPPWGRHAAMIIMLPAVYLFLSNPIGPAPSSAKALTAHPLNWGVILWASGHLLANGDLAHALLFLTFLLFSALSIASGNLRGQKPALAHRPPLRDEAVFMLIVLIVYGFLVWAHAYFTGMPLIKA